MGSCSKLPTQGIIDATRHCVNTTPKRNKKSNKTITYNIPGGIFIADALRQNWVSGGFPAPTSAGRRCPR